jgi:hypothetical protein
MWNISEALQQIDLGRRRARRLHPIHPGCIFGLVARITILDKNKVLAEARVGAK